MILELHTKFLFIYIENARQAFLEIPSIERKKPNLYDDLDEEFGMFLESVQNSFELCSSVKQCEKERSTERLNSLASTNFNKHQ